MWHKKEKIGPAIPAKKPIIQLKMKRIQRDAQVVPCEHFNMGGKRHKQLEDELAVQLGEFGVAEINPFQAKKLIHGRNRRQLEERGRIGAERGLQTSQTDNKHNIVGAAATALGDAPGIPARSLPDPAPGHLCLELTKDCSPKLATQQSLLAFQDIRL